MKFEKNLNNRITLGFFFHDFLDDKVSDDKVRARPTQWNG